MTRSVDCGKPILKINDNNKIAFQSKESITDSHIDDDTEYNTMPHSRVYCIVLECY